MLNYTKWLLLIGFIASLLGCPEIQISISAQTTVLQVGDTLQLTVQSTDSYDTSFSWGSSTPAVATIDASGRVTAIAPGLTTITVRANHSGETATLQLTVEGETEGEEEGEGEDEGEVEGEDEGETEGQSEGEEEGESSGTSMLAYFDAVWKTFDQYYAFFVYKELDWLAISNYYRPNFVRPMTEDEFALRLQDVLNELHDWQVRIIQPDGLALGYEGSFTPNHPPQPLPNYARNGVYESLGNDTLRHAWVTEQIAYLRIDSLEKEAFDAITETQLEALFRKYVNAEGIIIDLRANEGGALAPAARIAGRFTDATLTYAFSDRRDGPNHDDFSGLVSRLLTPTSGTHYYGNVLCLIGQRCMGTAESLALMLRSTYNARLVGDRSRGAIELPQTFELDTGLQFTVPRWLTYTTTRQIVEDNGIHPDYPVDPTASYDATRDYVIEAALQILDPLP